MVILSQLSFAHNEEELLEQISNLQLANKQYLKTIQEQPMPPWIIRKTKDDIRQIPDVVLDKIQMKHGLELPFHIPKFVKYNKTWCTDDESRIARGDFDNDGKEDIAFWIWIWGKNYLYLYETTTSSIIILEQFSGEPEDIPVISVAYSETIQEENVNIGLISRDPCQEKGLVKLYFKEPDGSYKMVEEGC